MATPPQHATYAWSASGTIGLSVREGDGDRGVCSEVIETDCYRLRHIRAQDADIRTVLDLGANMGAFSAHVHALYPYAQIEAHELLSENLGLLRHNVGSFAQVRHSCISTLPPEEVLVANSNLHGVYGGSYVFPDWQLPELSTDEYAPTPVTAEVVSFEAIMEGREEVDLVKMDIEGSEDAILSASPSLRRARWIVGEFHNIDHWIGVIDEVLPDHTKLIERDPDMPTMGLFVMTSDGDLSGFPPVFPEAEG